MSEPRSLPARPDLRHLRDEAKRRRKAGEFSSLALAQLAIARGYRFPSRPPRTEDQAIGSYLAGNARDLPDRPALSLLAEMLILSIKGGHLEAMRRLLDLGAPVDGDPDGDDIPLGHACWRGRIQLTRELVERGAALTFRDGGSAIGAALHGSRHCHHLEGRPTMRIADEIPKEPYAQIVRLLLSAGRSSPNVSARTALARRCSSRNSASTHPLDPTTDMMVMTTKLVPRK